jgi:hypothetical protein
MTDDFKNKTIGELVPDKREYRGRPKKYKSSAERKEAIKKSKKDYYERNKKIINKTCVKRTNNRNKIIRQIVLDHGEEYGLKVIKPKIKEKEKKEKIVKIEFIN